MNKISVGTRVFACLTSVFLIVGLVLTLVRLDTASSMYEQSAADRWAEQDYTQISIFWLPNEGFDHDAVYSYRQMVNTALESESIAANSNNSGTWYDAYSTVTSVTAYTSRTSSSLRAVVTGGNYFYIHSHQLLSANYYEDNGSSADFCVIDENAAWKLF